MLSSPHDSPFILVLCVSKSSRNSDGLTPCRADKQRWGRKMSQFSTNTRHRYISKMVEDRWVYAAKHFTSTESSFHPCNIYRIYRLRFSLRVDIERIINSHIIIIIIIIVPGAYPGEAKMCLTLLM